MASVELVIASFLFIMLVASLVSIRVRVPYTLILVLVGISLAVVFGSFVLGGGELQSVISQIRSFNQALASGPGGGLFVGLVVPPLIFEAMIQIRSSDLKDVIRPAFILATIGVLITTLVGGILLWQLSPLPFAVSLLFAAIIAPTDVATVLEIFRRARVPRKLAALLDTEAAFNDATGLVIFAIILASLTLSKVSFVNAAGSFALTLGGGLIIGFGVAFLAELVASAVSDSLSETLLTITAVYGSYTLATGFGFSGLIAVSVVGLYFGNLTVKSALQPKTRESIRIFWSIAAFFGNSIAFLFIGFQTNVFILIPSLGLIDILGLIGIAYLAVIVARLATVYPILTIFDRFGSKIPWKWRHVTMLGGARGALSIALVASLTTSSVTSLTDNDTITVMVLGVAFISISLQAGVLFRYIHRSFPEDREIVNEELNARLAKTISAIESLQKLKKEDKISDQEFANHLQNQGEELANVLADVDSSLGPRRILKSRLLDLYHYIKNLLKEMMIRPSNHKANLDSTSTSVSEKASESKQDIDEIRKESNREKVKDIMDDEQS